MNAKSIMEDVIVMQHVKMRLEVLVVHVKRDIQEMELTVSQ